MTGRLDAQYRIEGFVAKGFEPISEVFERNFVERNEGGAACCIYRHGEKVVDLWGGVADAQTGAPWLEDTMAMLFSATKGLAAMTLALAHSRGWLDYDARVASYWPEFAANGKAEITVRQLLAHQAALFAFTGTVDRATIAVPDRLAAVLAAETPAWKPGERQSYHALSLGFYEGELLRRIDPQHRTLGQFFADEIAGPLGLEAYIRLPEDIPNARLAPMQMPNMLKALLRMPPRMAVGTLNPRSNLFRALLTNPGSHVVFDPETVYARNLEVPSGGGVATARAVARAYSAFATGGKELGLRPETLAALAAPAIPSASGFMDAAIGGEVQFSLGFMKSSPTWPVGHASAFGAPGAGGALAFADPDSGIGYAYVTNRMSAKMLTSTREEKPREALARCLRA